jgi:hypothetical protein
VKTKQSKRKRKRADINIKGDLSVMKITKEEEGHYIMTKETT